jgi:hypothetical protein
MTSLEIPSTPWLALLALGVFTLYQLQSHLRSSSDVPIVGRMWLSLLSLGNLNPMDKAMVEAYKKVSPHSNPHSTVKDSACREFQTNDSLSIPRSTFHSV